ncbi:MAG: maleate cis-trans isomerase family protein, partial [Egibacteraceae bacterium]
MTQRFRVGLIVPSSNVTMETEIPEMLRRREAIADERYTFHSSRMRMRQVSVEELRQMDHESVRCALELSDARVDVMAYACLVAIMSQGAGYHCRSEQRLTTAAADNGGPARVVSSAGALVEALGLLGAERIAMITPYVTSLTAQVADYIEGSGMEVADTISLEVADNDAVGRLDAVNLRSLYQELDLDGVDALVLSACVQMPSLASIQVVEDESGLPVLSAATATVRKILDVLGRDPHVPGAGRLLA